MSDKEEFTISWRTCVRIAVTILVVLLFAYFWGALEQVIELLLGGMFAIIAGLVIAYILNIPMRFFESKLPGPTGDGTRNRTLSMVLTYICAVAVLLLVVILVLPNLVGAVIKLAEAAPGVIDSIEHNEFLLSVLPASVLEQIQSIDWEKVVMDVAAWLQSGLSSSLPQIMSVFGRIGACFMGVILSFWFLGEKNKLCEGVHTLIRTYAGKRADAFFAKAIAIADGSFRGYFTGAAMEGVIFGGIVAIACTIAGVPEAPMLGALVGVMSLIPMIGALIGAILGAIIILPTSWQHALIFLVLFFIVQQIEANFIYPRVVGSHVGLTGMWPLIGVTLGVALFGFVGAFIGVPLIATIFRIVEADLERRRQLPEDGPSPLERLSKSISS